MVRKKIPKALTVNVKPLKPGMDMVAPPGDMLKTDQMMKSPVDKKSSIHDLLRQMSVPKNHPDAAAGLKATRRWRGTRKLYDDFCTETSFTAITRIYKAKHLYKRIAWLVLAIGMMIWLSVQCYWLFEKYFSYPVEVKIEMKAAAMLNFPSITICNLNPLKKNQMHREPFLLLANTFHIDESDTLYDDYFQDLKATVEAQNLTNPMSPMNETFDEYLKDMMQTNNYNRWESLDNDTGIAETFYSEMDDSHTAAMAYAAVAVSLDSDNLEGFGHQLDDLLMSCSYMGMACSPHNFTYVRNNKYGNCYTFNSKDSGQDALATFYAGPLMGLTLELNIEQAEYVPAMSQDAGVRVLIHKRGTHPFPEDEGFSIPPGYKTSIGLELRELTRLPPPHADCGNTGVGVYNYYVEEFGAEYTKQACLKSCYQALIIEKCKCAFALYHVPQGQNVCNYDSNFTVCMEAMMETLGNCNDKCPTPCKELKYGQTMSMSKWPSEQYEGYLDKKLQKVTSQFMGEDGRQDSDDTVAKIEVYYKELVREIVEQQKAYESQNLISDIGGQLGLWLGLSAITIGELFEFIASIIRLSSRKVLNRADSVDDKSHMTKISPLEPNV